MRVHLGGDHAGCELKAHLVGWLRANGHEPVDHGPAECDEQYDYPPFVLRTATAVVSDPGSVGIVLGGSGNGEAMAANKVRGVRAALVWSEETARLARDHNDANVVSLGARTYSVEEATAFVAIFLATPFSGDARHARRLGMLSDYEMSGVLPPLPAPGG